MDSTKFLSEVPVNLNGKLVGDLIATLVGGKKIRIPVHRVKKIERKINGELLISVNGGGEINEPNNLRQLQ